MLMNDRLVLSGDMIAMTDMKKLSLTNQVSY
jgi:hypothetical protein